MSHSRITFEIPNSEIAMVISVLAGSVSSLQLVPVDSPQPVKSRLARRMKPRSETVLGLLVMRLLRGFTTPVSISTLQVVPEYVEAGFNPTSISPCLSGLVASGHVVRTGRRGAYYYSLA